MGFDFGVFEDQQLSEEYVEWLVDEKSVEVERHFGKLWDYYANRMSELASGRSHGQSGLSAVESKYNDSSRCYVQAQEYGLPSRITGVVHSAGGGIFAGTAVRDLQRKEVVIENDIGWRINAMSDFLFGKPISLVSKAPDGRRRAEIGKILKAVFEANGGISFFQDMAVLGSVYGFVDCVVRPGESVAERTSFKPTQPSSFEKIIELAQAIDLELIEALRALPILDENDYKKTKYYIQHFGQQKNSLSRKNSFLSRLLGRQSGGGLREIVAVTEVLGPGLWQRYENKELVAQGTNPFGLIPVVHIQNVAQPYYYEGQSDVEPLIPLQDELNTRLSDRANRITFQSFKMYLAKGIEGIEERPVSPGRMWCTDNLDAKIEEFGGEPRTNSEDFHITEIREAMDKSSGVTPVVAGVLKEKLGNLTSAVALKIVLMGMLARTERKRFSYGEGVKRICRLVLQILDKTGVYPNGSSERDIEIIFPSPLPENIMEKLQEAQVKKELGVSQEQVLRELGYEAAE